MPTTSRRLAHMPDDELTALAAQAPTDGMTLEQRALMHLDARNEAGKIFRRYRRNAIIGFAVLALGITGARFADVQQLSDQRASVRDSANAAAIGNCNRTFRLAYAQRLALMKLPRDPGQRPLTQVQLEALTPLPDCRNARVVTDNPNTPVKEPAPLHDPKQIAGE